MLDEHDRGIYAAEVIREVIEELQKRYDEIYKNVDPKEESFDTGLMTGYQFAKEMLQSRAYGLILENPDNE